MTMSEDLKFNIDEIVEKETESDADDCDETELERTFNSSYSFSTERALTLDRNYILHISCTNEPDPKICIGLSNHLSEIYSISKSHLNKIVTLKHDSNIVNVKFSNDNNIVYTGTTNNVKIWDLRIPKEPVVKFNDDKPLLHFDVSPNNRLLCASSELYKGDAFLLFWDIRKHSLLGGYWESHTDDITKVMFHPTDNNKLASGSTDGLVNIYNLVETNEDDALLNSLNTDSTVEQILWYSTNKKDSICCVTHTQDVQVWDVDEATPYHTFGRPDIAEAIRRKSADHCYIAGAHLTTPENVFLLAGSNWNKGECVRAVNIENNKKLVPNFKLNNNKQRIRASWYNNETGLFVTGGEQCILSVWEISKQPGQIMKILGKVKKEKNVKPY